MRRVRWSIAVLCTLAALAAQTLALLYRVDRCLDVGGTYIYEEEGCSTSSEAVGAPVGPWVRAPRAGELIFAVAVIGLVGFAPDWMRRRREVRSRPTGAV